LKAGLTEAETTRAKLLDSPLAETLAPAEREPEATQ
jgi:hypothetical protein